MTLLVLCPVDTPMLLTPSVPELRPTLPGGPVNICPPPPPERRKMEDGALELGLGRLDWLPHWPCGSQLLHNHHDKPRSVI